MASCYLAQNWLPGELIAILKLLAVGVVSLRVHP